MNDFRDDSLGLWINYPELPPPSQGRYLVKDASGRKYFERWDGSRWVENSKTITAWMGIKPPNKGKYNYEY